jgi:biotin carboxylase
VLLLLPKTSYRSDDFRAAAARLGVGVMVASDRCHVLGDEWGLAPSLTLDLDRPEEAAAAIVAEAERAAVDAVIATDEPTAVIAARAAQALGLPHNPVAAAQATRNKRLLREALAKAGVRQPAFAVHSLEQSATDLAPTLRFPCVLKPLLLSASQGVMRADDMASFAVAWERLRNLLLCPEMLHRDPEGPDGKDARRALVEEFIPGPEVALEGLLDDGALRTLALFDKPDALDGPFFEETLYVTPSRHPPAAQDAVANAVQSAARALGLRDGPVHAELRLGAAAPVVLEIAARSIGGLCSRTLRFGTGLSLEEILLRHALALPIESLDRERAAAGVMMLPIPRAGVLRQVSGVEAARATPGIEDVVISVRPGENLIPLPEGASYLGFVFARGETPAGVEAALRNAHAHLSFDIRARL